MAVVSFKEATRIYPKSKRRAVDSLNLEIRDGEFLVHGPGRLGLWQDDEPPHARWA